MSCGFHPEQVIGALFAVGHRGLLPWRRLFPVQYPHSDGAVPFFKISGVHFAFHKLGACDNLLQKLQISANAANLEFIQCSKQAPNGSITVFTPGNDLCQQ